MFGSAMSTIVTSIWLTTKPKLVAAMIRPTLTTLMLMLAGLVQWSPEL
jgi:hypothetical protein